MPQLPPLALTWQSSGFPMETGWGQGVGRGYGAPNGRIYVDRSGAVRFDRFASADATVPSGSTILNANHRVSGMAPVDSEVVWVDQGHESFEDDPRKWLRGFFNVGGGPGCETARDQGDDGDAKVATGWRYVDLEYVAERPAHHVMCGGNDLWIDIETGLFLRMREPAVDNEHVAIAGQFMTTEVTDIAFGEQPAALFEGPEGLARISPDEYGDYICENGLPNELMPGISDCPSPEETAAPPTPEPSPTPVATESSTANACPVRPGDSGQPIGPLTWTPESMNEDWPASIRPERAGGGIVQPMPATYLDRLNDNQSDAYPCVDIRWVKADTSEVDLKLGSKPPPWSCSDTSKCSWVEPTEQWIAYGIVTDEDGDGVPDWRFGIDNMPADAVEEGLPRRGWRTNLHTGQTEAGPYQGDPPWGRLGGGFQGGTSTDSADWDPDAEFRFNGAVETTQGSQGWGFELDMPFYTWASVIVNGRVVATDYAPDHGWLVAKPGVAITPNKFPGGTWLLEELPVGHGWDDQGSLPLRVSMTVPYKWTVGGPWGESDPGSPGLDIGVVGDPWDGCPDTTEPKLGPSYDDLLTYLANDVPQIDILESTDVTVDGYRGRYIRSAPVDKWFDCFGGSPIPTGEVWIVDVDGARVVIAAGSDEALSEAAESEIRQIVESIHFER